MFFMFLTYGTQLNCIGIQVITKNIAVSSASLIIQNESLFSLDRMVPEDISTRYFYSITVLKVFIWHYDTSILSLVNWKLFSLII